ncbi:hypothetical protein P280DRAFT_60209 [Massarina eburnea CBS 473.64]|uniref:Uncharacterized protein n=1 Tax=Massarina eburnea CBS 473.64 TaxID=1395130 RepID=A0A6A6RZJ0_9PLEO|nr:hypothetical protein P280DRAFT_60209 [Massarina eburnea CBS 473.64]
MSYSDLSAYNHLYPGHFNSDPVSIDNDNGSRASFSNSEGPGPEDSVSQAGKAHGSSSNYTNDAPVLEPELAFALDDAIIGQNPFGSFSRGENTDPYGEEEQEEEAKVEVIDRQPTRDTGPMEYQPQTTKYSENILKVHLLHHDSGKTWKGCLRGITWKGCAHGLVDIVRLKPWRTGLGCCSPTGCCEACECKNCCAVLYCPCCEYDLRERLEGRMLMLVNSCSSEVCIDGQG